MQYPIESKAPTSSSSGVTFIVLTCAMLVGSSAGVLIADREASVARNVAAAAKAVGSLAGQPSKSNPADGKAQGSKATKSTAKSSAETQPSAPMSVGDIHYSEQPDSASLDIELGPAVLVGTDKAHNPERIYFDLRDSQRPESSADGLKARKAVRTDGTLIHRVRVSEWESGAIRVVLDVKRPCDYTYEVAPGPSPRLVVKVQPRTAGEFVSN